MVLKFSHLDLVNVTYPISRTRWNLSFNFCVIVQLVKTGPLVVHGSQVLALRLNVHWIKGFDIFLHGKYNVIICTKTKRFFFHYLYPLCYWSHIYRVEHLHLTQFSTSTLKSIFLAHKRFDSVYFYTQKRQYVPVIYQLNVKTGWVLPHRRCNLFVLQYWFWCLSKRYFSKYPMAYLTVVGKYKELLFLFCKCFRPSITLVETHEAIILFYRVVMFVSFILFSWSYTKTHIGPIQTTVN